MNIQELRKLGTEAAAELTALRGNDWVIETEKDDTWPSLVLAETATQARLRLIYGWFAPGKVTAEGIFPESTAPRIGYRANIDPGRGGARIGREADRRVLRSGYLGELPAALERRARMDDRARHVAMRLGQAASLLGVEVEDGRVFVGEFVLGSGYAEMYSASFPDTMSLNISGIPAVTALEMLAILRKRAWTGQIASAGDNGS
jgi:hypothetical protein